MANYNADIRVGITGKTQLNALERQLGRINKDLNQINKSLKAQTLTINTKGATRALDQLDRKISRLNRTINVNANINERRSRSEGGNTTIVGGGSSSPIAQAAVGAALNEQLKTTKQLEKAESDRIETNKKLNDQFNKINSKKQEEAKLLDQIDRVEKGARVSKKGEDFNRVAGGLGLGNKTEPALKELNKRLNGTRTSIRNLEARVPKLSSAFAQASKNVNTASDALDKNNKKLRENAKNQEAAAEAAKKRAKFNKGFNTGFGVTAASATGNIPILNEAVTGGLVASLSGGSVAAGALAGGLVGIGAAAVAATADVTKFNNALRLQQRALANTVATTDELRAAFSAIEGVSRDFVVPIGEATEQFTKLNAAARASGFTVEEVEEVYRGLAAANVALGGDSQKLQGILLATQQVFSKGKVQAEELRGQIGERLAGAFAKFAESAGLSTSQLDKALEKGEVSLEDFVRFAQSLLEEYEEDAKKIADSPENASARLKNEMDSLKRAMGPILTDIGNFFIELANTIVKQLTRMFNALNEFRRRAAQGLQERAANNIKQTVKDLQAASANRGDGFGQTSERELGLIQQRLQTQTQQYLNATKELRSLEANLDGDLDASGKAVPDKPKPTTQQQTSSKSGGGSSSGPRSTLADTQLEIQLQKELLAIEQKNGRA